MPIIVAVNKIDKAEADPDRVKRELAEQGLSPEEWGGETIFVHVSAKEDTGIDQLLEMILLQAEVMELKANPDKLARGHVVESQIDSGRGAVATVLVREGTLKTGDAIVCGAHFGRIRAMLNDRGKQVDSAGPSIPAEILGLSGVPMAGDEFIALADEKTAKQISEHRMQKQRSKDLASSNRLSLDKLYEQLQAGSVKDLNLILKADVHGSIEALGDALTKLSNDEVKVNIVHSATGTITESDIPLAAVSNAIILGFNVRPSTKVQALANEEGIDMRFYNVIYDVIKDVKNAMVGLMESTYKEHILGSAEVREMFHIPKIGAVAGCYVTDGKLERSSKLRLVREGTVVYEGKNSSLRRFKDDVKEVQSGYECGIGIENYNDIKMGDVIEFFYLEEIKPELDLAHLFCENFSQAIKMVVGIGTITFRLHDCHSLKGKRRIVKKIVAQLRNHFNASVAEVDANDVYQKAIIGFAMAGNQVPVINSKMDKLVNMAEDLGLAEIIDSEMEIIHL